MNEMWMEQGENHLSYYDSIECRLIPILLLLIEFVYYGHTKQFKNDKQNNLLASE